MVWPTARPKVYPDRQRRRAGPPPRRRDRAARRCRRGRRGHRPARPPRQRPRGQPARPGGGRRRTRHHRTGDRRGRRELLELVQLTGAGARRTASPARSGGRGRGPSQRGQVDAGQPHPRPARGRGAGRPGRDPRPDRLRRGVGRAAVHPGRHRRLGAGCARAAGDGFGAGRARGRHRRRRPVRRGRAHRRDRDRPGGRPHAAAFGSAGHPRRRPRSTTSAASPTPRSCGRSGSASRTWSAACTGGGAATCSTPCWLPCPTRPMDEDVEGGPRRVALIGRPNVGKSSLLNRLTREERAVVDSVAGTTIDPVDSLVELDGEIWRFVDTAGLRRRVNQASGMEYYASLRTAAAIEAAEVAVVLLDASETISEQDQRVVADVVDAGPRARPRAQQVGPARRGPPLATRARDRPRLRPRRVGAAGQRVGQDRPRRRQARRRTCAPAWRRGTSASRPAG